MIPFSPPRIDEKTIEAVTEALRSGWITTGPKTKEFELQIAAYLGVPRAACFGSWTGAAELVLRWFGIGPGDEVIVPAYTYAASANIICHTGAKPIFVDSLPGEFNLDPAAVEAALSSDTKAVIPVDIGGYPANNQQLREVISSASFQAANPVQELLGRPL
ncbi:MAG: DegT/DnrJ/EryC1/StrS aminotransferase family protein, partial [Flavobacteriales bacterium]|nr:DegT/DnrJ/EryC1/StrS aminotransferase family protein [Flavobacteriales bacterium]